MENQQKNWKDALVYRFLNLPVVNDTSEETQNSPVPSHISAAHRKFFESSPKTEKEREMEDPRYQRGTLFIGYVKPLWVSGVVVAIMEEYIRLVDAEMKKWRKKGDHEAADYIFTHKQFVSFEEYCLYFSSSFEKLFPSGYTVSGLNGEGFSFEQLRSLEQYYLFRVAPEHLKNENGFLSIFQYLKQHYTPDERGYYKLLTTRKPNKTLSSSKNPDNKPLQIADYFTKLLPVCLLEQILRLHTIICSGTGSGKSELMKFLIYSYMRQEPFCTLILIDPHGGLTEQVVRLKAFFAQSSENSKNSHNTSRIIYFDPGLDHLEKSFPSLNVFESPKGASERHIDIQTQEIVEALGVMFQNSNELTTNMSLLLKACVATLIRRRRSTMNDLYRFMIDADNRDLVECGKHSSNTIHQAFFTTQFHKKSFNRSKQALANRLSEVLASHIMHEVLSRPSTIDLEQCINAKKCIIFNLSPRSIGETNTKLLGKLILSMMKTIFKRRKKENPIPCHAFLDEFPEYALSDTLGTILEQLRGYGLHLTLAHQQTSQVDQKLRKSLLGNSGVKIIGRNNLESLKTLANETGVELEALQKLDVGHFYIKTNNSPAFPFQVPNFLMKPEYRINETQWESFKKSQLKMYYRSSDENTNEGKNEPSFEQPQRTEQTERKHKASSPDQHHSEVQPQEYPTQKPITQKPPVQESLTQEASISNPSKSSQSDESGANENTASSHTATKPKYPFQRRGQ